MLQQTRVETVIPYFERFVRRFPNLKSLAKAEQSEVLALWEGLGYYTRARNLHKAARLVMEKFNGSLPAAVTQLSTLPGIGRYTAGAIASIAFDQSEPALDANIKRIYSRVLALEEPLGSTVSERKLWSFARQICPQQEAGDFNQALMDLGASICTPLQPRCGQCPLQNFCLAFQYGKQSQIPLLRKKPAVPHFTVTAAVIRQNDRLLIQQRPQSGLLAGLWEFPGGKLEPSDQNLPGCLQREILEEIGVRIRVEEPFGVFKHAYTHFRITLHAFLCHLEEDNRVTESPTLLWVKPSQLNDFAMGKVDREIARRLNRNSTES